MEINININREALMHVVEGLTATIGEHRPDVNFKAIWASESEQKKLDIFYREAVADLETRLSLWAKATTGQYTLTATGTDYTLTIVTDRHWPAKLQGVVTNKIQDYLVHAVSSGWLSTFGGEETGIYGTMAASDLKDIRYLLGQRAYSRTYKAQQGTSDADKTPDSETDITTSERKTDADKTPDSETDITTSERKTDAEKTDDSERTVETSERKSNEKKDWGTEGQTATGIRHDRNDDGKGTCQTHEPTAQERKTDTEKTDDSERTVETSERKSNEKKDWGTEGQLNGGERKKDLAKEENQDYGRTGEGRKIDTTDADKQERRMTGRARHEDDTRIHHCQEDIDWNGAGLFPSADRHNIF